MLRVNLCEKATNSPKPIIQESKEADSTIKKKKNIVKEVLRGDILQQVAVMVAAEWLSTDCPESLRWCASVQTDIK